MIEDTTTPRRRRETDVQSELVRLCDPSSGVTDKDVLVCVVEIGYGKGNQNPVDSTRFFTTVRNAEAETVVGFIPSDRVSAMVPRAFVERWVRVWCRDPSKLACVTSAFELWCRGAPVYRESSPIQERSPYLHEMATGERPPKKGKPESTSALFPDPKKDIN